MKCCDAFMVLLVSTDQFQSRMSYIRMSLTSISSIRPVLFQNKRYINSSVNACVELVEKYMLYLSMFLTISLSKTESKDVTS